MKSTLRNLLVILPRGFSFQSRQFHVMAPLRNDYTTFKKRLNDAKYVLALTGAGISAESGIPTFRGEGGLWRDYVAQELATPEAFERDPSLVWEFYHHRREVVFTKTFNEGHTALARCEERFREQGKHFVTVTQNIDGLHATAGCKDVIEMHGSLFKTRCTKCGHVEANRNSPICEALRGRGAPKKADLPANQTSIPVDALPRCQHTDAPAAAAAVCSGLLRPHVVWFGEALDTGVLANIDRHMAQCDLCLVIGTSSVVYPAAAYGPQLALRGVTVAEFNMEETDVTQELGFHFQGPSSKTLTEALSP